MNLDASIKPLERLRGAEWELLRNSLAGSVREIIAVEAESEAQIRDLVLAIRTLFPDRAVSEIPFSQEEDDPGKLLQRMEEACASNSKDGEQLLLCIARGGKAPVVFWKQLNLMRERMADLSCQALFILLPEAYQNLSRHADHLKRWMAMKIRLRLDAPPPDETLCSDSPHQAAMGLLPFRQARTLLETLDRQLREAKKRAPAEIDLLENYYRPMFEAAVSLHNNSRAASLLGRIESLASSISADNSFLFLKIQHHINCHDLEQAERLGRELVKHLESSEQTRKLPMAYHQLGSVFLEQRKFAEAEANYRTAIDWTQKTGQPHQLGSTYHQLGRVFQEQRKYAEAEKNYRIAIDWKQKTGHHHQLGISYHQLGRVFLEQRNWVEAEANYRTAIEWFEKTGQPQQLGSTYHQLGRVFEEREEWSKAAGWYFQSLENHLQYDGHPAELAVVLRSCKRILGKADSPKLAELLEKIFAANPGLADRLG